MWFVGFAVVHFEMFAAVLTCFVVVEAEAGFLEVFAVLVVKCVGLLYCNLAVAQRIISTILSIKEIGEIIIYLLWVSNVQVQVQCHVDPF